MGTRALAAQTSECQSRLLLNCCSCWIRNHPRASDSLLRAAAATCDLDSIKTKQLIFLRRRRDHLEHNIVEFSMSAIERRLVSSLVCELDQLHSPFSKRRVLRDRYDDIKVCLRKILVRR